MNRDLPVWPVAFYLQVPTSGAGRIERCWAAPLAKVYYIPIVMCFLHFYLNIFIKGQTIAIFMIELDGSYGEGGGQIIRTALALSTLTQQPFRCTNIRKGRKEQGLKAQHLESINALKHICNAKTNEINIGSLELEFHPGKINAGTFKIDIGTAGSIALLLQAVLPPCLFAPGRIKLIITGGTCGKWQAPVEYLQQVLLPHLRKFAESIEIKLIKRGYYPKGGGNVEIIVTPTSSLADFSSFTDFYAALNKKVKKISLAGDFQLLKINGISHAAKSLQDKKVAERQAAEAEKLLKGKYKCPIDMQVSYQETASAGTGITLWAVFGKNGETDEENPCILGADALGEAGKPAEKVGEEAARKLIEEIGAAATVDEHLQDQLLLFMALLPGSTVRFHKLTEHAKTNMYVIERFLPVRFVVEIDTMRVERKEETE